MHWIKTKRTDPNLLSLADRHYSRQTIGGKGIASPARSVCLISSDRKAGWVLLAPFPEYVQHAWRESWDNRFFRNESEMLSSELIREAVAVSLWVADLKDWGPPLRFGIITMVDPTQVRHKRDPGRCYLKAGFKYLSCAVCDGSQSLAGFRCHRCTDGRAVTKGGKLVLGMSPEDMPSPAAPRFR